MALPNKEHSSPEIWLKEEASSQLEKIMDALNAAYTMPFECAWLEEELGQNYLEMLKEMESLLQKPDSEIEQTIRAELGAKARALVAELAQGDNYTKRARPTVVYAGLIFIFYNYCVVPTIQSLTDAAVVAFALPTEFELG